MSMAASQVLNDGRKSVSVLREAAFTPLLSQSLPANTLQAEVDAGTGTTSVRLEYV